MNRKKIVVIATSGSGLSAQAAIFQKGKKPAQEPVKRLKYYIAGKVTGVPSDVCSKKFGDVEKKLKEIGHNVYNPVHLVELAEKTFETNDGDPLFKTWEDYMKFLLPYLINCDVLCLMPCWNESKGAMLERDIALRLNIKIVHSIDFPFNEQQ